MPPRPFPFPIGIGTDIVNISRISRLVDSTTPSTAGKLPQFLNRFLTLREQQEFRTRYQDVDASRPLDAQVARYLAGRWAAKEAVIKAWHPRRLMLTDIEILKYPATEQTKGVFALVRDLSQESAGKNAAKDAEVEQQSTYEELEGQIAKISISHDGEYATAVCLAVNEPMDGDVGGEAAARMP